MARQGETLSDAEVRRIQLDVLRTFTSYCDDNGLTYMLAYGSLLGAVRHGGYIPWDDDVDVMMPREDYERLRATSSLRGLRVGGAHEDTSWPYSNVKVGDTETEVVGDGPFVSGIGVGIDVFPVDGIATGARGRLQCVLIDLVRSVLVLQSLLPDARRSPAKRAVVRMVVPVSALVPRRLLLRVLEQQAISGAPDAKDRGVLVGSYRWSVPSIALRTTQPIRFESLDLRAPEDTAAVLTAKYGPSYMTPPPPERQVTHHSFSAYRR